MYLNLRNLDFGKRAEGELESIAEKARVLVDESFTHWRGARLLRENDSRSFAVVVKWVGNADLTTLYDNPEALFDFAVLHDGDGTTDYNVQRYAANALRKMKAVARTGVDTLVMRHTGTPFENITDVSGDKASMLPFGEFPYGGAVLIGSEGNRVLVGVSGFTEEEDHVLAQLVAGFVWVRLIEQLRVAA